MSANIRARRYHGRPARFAARGEARKADGSSDVGRNTCSGEKVSCMDKQLECLGIVEQQLEMLAGGARLEVEEVDTHVLSG